MLLRSHFYPYRDRDCPLSLAALASWPRRHAPTLTLFPERKSLRRAFFSVFWMVAVGRGLTLARYFGAHPLSGKYKSNVPLFIGGVEIGDTSEVSRDWGLSLSSH